MGTPGVRVKWSAQYGVALAAFALACSGGAQNGGAQVQALRQGDIRATGTVQLTPVGVNCWRFAAADGTGYELQPDQAPPGVLVDGKQMTLVLRLRADLMSTCQVGQLVDVVRVE